MNPIKNTGAPEFVMMTGLPGSGKSRYCEGLNEKAAAAGLRPYVIVSSDAIRKELYGDENVRGDRNEVFGLATERLVSALGNGENAVLDSTNLSKKKRRHMLETVRRSCGEVFATSVWMAVTLEICLNQDACRERMIGKSVIEMMYRSFAPPGTEEGFDRILLCCRGGECEPGYTLEGFLEAADVYDRRNGRQTPTLGGHSRRTAEIIRDSAGAGGNRLLEVVGLIHDSGKLRTATPYNSRGELTDRIHYYRHNCCGAYDTPFFLRNTFPTIGDDAIVYAANLVYYHMHPHVQWKDGKARARDTRRLDPGFVSDLMLLHKADEAAH